MRSPFLRSAASPFLRTTASSVLLLGILSLTVLSGCMPVYRPYSNGFGYSDVQVAKDTWEVSYTGTTELSELQAKKLALLRAAELTNLSGHRWMRIVEQETSSRKVHRTSHEITKKPLVDTVFAKADAPQVVSEVTTREDAWQPTAVVVVAAEAAESPETLDAEGILREGRASGVLPKRK